MENTVNETKAVPVEVQKRTPIKAVQKSELIDRVMPTSEQPERIIPQANMSIKDNPPIGNVENTVVVKGKSVEIKPTKLKYHRNRTALFYRVIDNIPLPEILAADVGVFDGERDGDKCMMDWLIAVFDDVKFIEKNYNEFDSAIIYKCLEIFKRLNGIKDVEEKNMKAKETKA